MNRRKYGFTESKIQRFMKEGRGSGEGEYYKPWLTVADVPSKGRVHRPYCIKTGRTHHLLSDIEYYVFLVLWWNDRVIDIREQFPLFDRSETMKIAAQYGIKHPRDNKTNTFLVVTTDFVVTNRATETIAYAVKESSALSNKRTLEKLQIERQYWKRRGIAWYIVTELHVKNIFTNNLAWIFNANFPKLYYSEKHVSEIVAELKHQQSTSPLAPIRIICKKIDQKFNFHVGISLAAVRSLLASKVIQVDLHKKHIQDLPLKDFLI